MKKLRKIEAGKVTFALANEKILHEYTHKFIFISYFHSTFSLAKSKLPFIEFKSKTF
jgi:hypothetical protein